jgi:alanine racemase
MSSRRCRGPGRRPTISGGRREPPNTLKLMPQRAIARVNLAAIERNVGRLRAKLAAGTELCAVVKADGYGHGAVPVARAALDAGAGWLAVATAEEAAALRAAAIGSRLLVLGAISGQELPIALAAGAELLAWSEEFVADVVASAWAPVRLHVKLDTGMGRLGTREMDEALRVAERVVGAGRALELAGAMTHFATADDDLDFLAEQLGRFEPFAAEVRRRWPGVVVHAANSAATLREAASHFDVVRCGIAIYGCDPMNQDPSSAGLEPALELTTYVSALKLARAGDSVGYGRRFIAGRDTWIATLPIGYGDGIRRALTNNCDVLLRGRRYPLVGTVSMDNITVDLGPEAGASVGDVATIIGRDGAELQTTEDLANRIGTINYEVLCGVSPRVPRMYHRDGEPG